MKEVVHSYEPIQTLNSYGVQKVVTVNNRTHKLFFCRCFSEQEAKEVAELKNKELKEQ